MSPTPSYSTPLAVAGALLLLVASLAVCPADEATAQRRFATIDSLRHIQSVQPRVGPPGTVVELFTENLPLQAKIHVGIGAMRAGFEALAEATQDTWGEVAATVKVPDYTTWERPIVFIVFNGVFSPIGISDPFHVTNEEGHVRRSGQITDEGLSCVTLRDDDQYIYALRGDLGNLKAGDEITVEGQITARVLDLPAANLSEIAAGENANSLDRRPCAATDLIDVAHWEKSTLSPPKTPLKKPEIVNSALQNVNFTLQFFAREATLFLF